MKKERAVLSLSPPRCLPYITNLSLHSFSLFLICLVFDPPSFAAGLESVDRDVFKLFDRIIRIIKCERAAVAQMLSLFLGQKSPNHEKCLHIFLFYTSVLVSLQRRFFATEWAVSRQSLTPSFFLYISA